MQLARMRHTRARVTGFTLIELMIVVMIISILVAIGYPSYGQYVVRSNIKAAETALYRIADLQEQFFLDNKTYADDLAILGYETDELGLDRDGQFTESDADDIIYVLTLTEAGATSYEISAEPQGTQADRDKTCETLTLDHNGVRGAKDVAACW